MFTKELQNNIDAALATLGVSNNSKKIFLSLLEHGPLRAKNASSLSGVRRELTYRSLEELVKKRLVKKNEPENGVAYFEPTHPELLVEMLKETNAHVNAVQNIISNNMSTFASMYNKGFNLPTIEFKEGLEGIKYLYADINDVGENIKLIRSPLDIQHPEIKKLVSEQRDMQVTSGIKVQLLTSFTYPSLEKSIKRDIENLVERRTIPENVLNIPAQIIIYGEKVAITSFEGSIVTTIIENTAIRDTFNILFTTLWNQGKTTQEMLGLKIR